MPRRKSLVTVIRELVQQEVSSAIQSLLSSVSPKKPTRLRLYGVPGRRRRLHVPIESLRGQRIPA